MKLSIYLCKEGFSQFEECIDPEWLLSPNKSGKNGNSSQKQGYYKRVEPSENLDFHSCAYIYQSSNIPKWHKFIKDSFPIGDMNSENFSCVILLRAMERIFALTFGYGYAALDEAKIETAFGLKTVLNMAQSGKLKRVQGKSLDSAPSIIYLQSPKPLSIAEQSINVYTNFITEVSAFPIDPFWGREIVGTDCFKTTIRNASVYELSDYCEKLFDLYMMDEYKKNHSYIDYIQPVKHEKAVLADLFSQLQSAFEKKDESIGIFYPDFLQEEPSSYKLSFENKTKSELIKECNELNIDDIFNYYTSIKHFCEENDANTDFDSLLSRIKLCPFDEDNNPLDKRRKIADYLNYECTCQSIKYVFSSGKWYSVEADYYESIQRQIKSIPDITGQVQLPDYVKRSEKYGEGDYNKEVARDHHMVLFDQKNYSVPDQPFQRIEVCDLYTKNNDFICVKKMASSAALSHLFAQMSVSAELLQRDIEYRRYTQNKIMIDKGWKVNFDNGVKDIKFILAVITDKPGCLHNSMFMMSKINLINHVQRVQALGGKVALCKISRNC